MMGWLAISVVRMEVQAVEADSFLPGKYEFQNRGRVINA